MRSSFVACVLPSVPSSFWNLASSHPAGRSGPGETRRLSMRLRNVLLAATVLSAPMAAKAQPIDGLYVGAGAGFNFKEDQKVAGFQPLFPGATGPRVPFPSGQKFRYDGGFVGLASL